MSVPFLPGHEQGSTLDGSLELCSGDLKHVPMTAVPDFDVTTIKQTELSDFGDEGFLLQNVVTASECQCFIDGGESVGFDTIRGVRDDYRSCKRITLHDEGLASILWSRIRAYVHDIVIEDDPHKLYIHGPPALMRGTWKPTGLNHIFRLCRYLPGGHFAPHFDGHYDKSPSERSLKTFMLYLNGDFTGGSTNFVDDKQTLYKDEGTGKYCAEEKNIVCSVQPEAGLAILFNHHRLHEGAKLGDGVKYILRTDIMYKNICQDVGEEYQQAVQLLQQAETLENAGECIKAMELYRKAFRMAPELEQSS